MDCTIIRLNLELFEKGELDEQRQKGMEEHLRMCPQCAEELKEIQTINALLDKIEIPQLPDNFTMNIMNKINKLQGTTNKTTNHWQNFRKWGISFVAAGFIMLLLNFTSLGTTIATLSTNLEYKPININKIMEYSPASLLNKGLEQLNLHRENMENRG
ncbi:zf-HC2 domain-containing protein [Irregularibacter muris]|uniref:Anti-sigma-W factor RsiW n=1 Tax=Irregularibacter muris TaxID=1796619 RepID=A0AAE3HGQ1_9FIRM|nr:zf-HC2 domain-containing protein [Irregularibacter muris]MCR1898283.1 zf-HC2 domain-containing protein [Irregularibacter muris]